MIYVGIDVAKDKHDCIIISSDGEIIRNSFTIKNNLEGFTNLIQSIPDVPFSILNLTYSPEIVMALT